MGQQLDKPLPEHTAPRVVNNKAEFQYELAMPDGEKAVLQYRWKKASLVLMHTIVPVSAQGHGVGAALVKFVLDEAREKGLKIIPYCSYVVDYLQKHPEYNDLIEPSHQL